MKRVLGYIALVALVVVALLASADEYRADDIRIPSPVWDENAGNWAMAYTAHEKSWWWDNSVLLIGRSENRDLNDGMTEISEEITTRYYLRWFWGIEYGAKDWYAFGFYTEDRPQWILTFHADSSH